ncbi:MAG: hypothetical protein COV43_06975 [Deltaproteobacteria bacterium CG11_big_fil_rev_8_21_14_0_20_42_23]|nr:MAG: hypothetical protein COV43_06975 [Deltaproteobacteria bacterium CG11_big_fil_rev_8_21_14_0_20_42_23]PJC65257.1 MAG: hypothetical protein CO021_00280 [Deltaproteobacteria bacterium CG_4_9_14_0_2_um_filter_42_21]
MNPVMSPVRLALPSLFVGMTVPISLPLDSDHGVRIPFGRELAAARDVALGVEAKINWPGGVIHFERPFSGSAEEYFRARKYVGGPVSLQAALLEDMATFGRVSGFDYFQSTVRGAEILYRADVEQLWDSDIPWAGLIREGVLDKKTVIEMMRHIQAEAKAYLKERDESQLIQRAWKQDLETSALLVFSLGTLVAFLLRAGAWSLGLGTVAAGVDIFNRYRASFLADRMVRSDVAEERRERAALEVYSASVAIQAIRSAERVARIASHPNADKSSTMGPHNMREVVPTSFF